MMKPRIASILFAAVAVLGAAACVGTVKERIAVASANTRAAKPLAEWVDVAPDHLAGVDPERLKAEGAALVVTRGVREGDGSAGPTGRLGIPHVVLLRDVGSTTIRSAALQRTGDEAEVGWGVAVVPPGRYALNRGRVRQTTSVRFNEARTTFTDTAGHPYVPLDATLSVGAGEVVYVGTVVWQAKTHNAAASRVFIRDERGEAAAWTRRNLPQFASNMRTKLLPPPVAALN
jgi:hypothetical protein